MSRTFNRYLYAIRALKEKCLCVRAVDMAHYRGRSASARGCPGGLRARLGCPARWKWPGGSMISAVK